MLMESSTPYFRNEVLRKRPYLTEEFCRRVIEGPERKEVQLNGRIRFWRKIEELGGKYLRVVTLNDGETIHNAFIDRGFKPEKGDVG
jgi:hypothetical protein